MNVETDTVRLSICLSVHPSYRSKNTQKYRIINLIGLEIIHTAEIAPMILRMDGEAAAAHHVSKVTQTRPTSPADA